MGPQPNLLHGRGTKFRDRYRRGFGCRLDGRRPVGTPEISPATRPNYKGNFRLVAFGAILRQAFAPRFFLAVSGKVEVRPLTSWRNSVTRRLSTRLTPFSFMLRITAVAEGPWISDEEVRATLALCRQCMLSGGARVPPALDYMRDIPWRFVRSPQSWSASRGGSTSRWPAARDMFAGTYPVLFPICGGVGVRGTG